MKKRTDGLEKTKKIKKIKNNHMPKKDLYFVSVSIIIAGAMISGAVMFRGESPKEDKPSYTETLSKEEVVSEVSLEAVLIDWPAMGEDDAPVVIVEYSDFACSFCVSFHKETLPLIKENYIDTGKVRFVYKDFPVVGGDKAAEAAHCAGEQESYWEYHNILMNYSNTERMLWSDKETHRRYALELGLNGEDLVECFVSGRYKNKVEEGLLEAQNLGGRGTPYFLVNGKEVSGAQPYSVFETLIEEELSQ